VTPNNKPQHAASAPAHFQSPPNLPTRNRGTGMPAPELNEIDSRYQAVIAGLSAADRATIEAYERAHIRLPLSDDDDQPQDDQHPLAYPENQEPFQQWKTDGVRVVNLRYAAALADVTGASTAQGVYMAMFCWRLNDGNGWWTRTNEGFASDLGISPDLFAKIRDALLAIGVIERRPAPPGYHPAMSRYQLKATRLNEIAYDYGVKLEQLPKPITGSLPLVADMPLSPVDNSPQNEGHIRYQRSSSPLVAESTNGVKNHQKPNSRARDDAPPFTGQPGADIENFSEPAKQQVGLTTPTAGDYLPRIVERLGPAPAPAPAEPDPPPPDDQQRAVTTLENVAQRLGLTVAPGAFASLCKRHGVTPEVAAALAQKAAQNGQQIRTFKWFDTVAPILRDELREAKQRGQTAVGTHASHSTASESFEHCRKISSEDRATYHTPDATRAHDDAITKMRALLPKAKLG